MLTFVCILVIMFTLALPLFATSEGAQQASDQRNAQHFCSLVFAANAAGVKVVDSKAKKHSRRDRRSAEPNPQSY